MTEAVLSLEVLGLLLTVALIGALVLAWREREGEGEGEGSA
jgi:NADH:ubiquinone oxidoreductase subunit 6 (subunit J)